MNHPISLRNLILIIFSILFISCIEKLPTQNNFPQEVNINSSIESMQVIISKDQEQNLDAYKFSDTWFPCESSIIQNDKKINNGYTQIKNQGHMVRNNLKPSYKLKWYSPENEIYNYSAQSADTSLSRYTLASYFYAKLDFIQPEVQYTNLFFNKRWLGLYIKLENINEPFFNTRNLIISDTYKLNAHGLFSLKEGRLPATIFDKKLPNNDYNYSKIKELILILDKASSNSTSIDKNDDDDDDNNYCEENEENDDSNDNECCDEDYGKNELCYTNLDTLKLSKILDIENVINYIAVTKVINNYDGITNNLYIYFNPNIQKFQIIPWDLDHTFEGSPNLNKIFENNLFEQIEKVKPWEKRINNKIIQIIEPEKDYQKLTEIVENIRIYAEAQNMYYTNADDDFNRCVNEIFEYLEQLNIELIQFKNQLD